MSDEFEYDEALNGMADILDSLENDESDESDEARRRPVRTPTGRGLFRSRPGTKFVTQVQLQAVLARVGGQIKTNATATKAIGTRVDQEVAARKKETAGIKKDVRKARDNALLPLLLQKPPELATIKFDKDDATKVVEVTYKKTNDMLLPLILMGGMGGGDGKDDDNSMMMLALVMMGR